MKCIQHEYITIYVFCQYNLDKCKQQTTIFVIFRLVSRNDKCGSFIWELQIFIQIELHSALEHGCRFLHRAVARKADFQFLCSDLFYFQRVSVAKLMESMAFSDRRSYLEIWEICFGTEVQALMRAAMRLICRRNCAQKTIQHLYWIIKALHLFDLRK